MELGCVVTIPIISGRSSEMVSPLITRKLVRNYRVIVPARAAKINRTN